MAQGMNAPLYTLDILRLAASLPEPVKLARVDGRSEQRSPTCGSTIRTEIALDPDGRVVAVSQEVQACAFGQASAALVAAGAAGRSHEDISAAIDDLAAWLVGEREQPGSWPGMTALAPARSRPSRHQAILLPLRALLAAMESGRP